MQKQCIQLKISWLLIQINLKLIKYSVTIIKNYKNMENLMPLWLKSVNKEYLSMK